MTAAADKAYTDLWRTYASHPLGAPESKTLTEILKFYFEPEEAALAARMSFQAEPEEVIAKRAGLSLEDASQLLTKMSSKFFIIGFRRPDGTLTFRLKLLAVADAFQESLRPFILVSVVIVGALRGEQGDYVIVRIGDAGSRGMGPHEQDVIALLWQLSIELNRNLIAGDVIDDVPRPFEQRRSLLGERRVGRG